MAEATATMVRLERVPADPAAPRLDWPGRPAGPLEVAEVVPGVRQRWGTGAATGRVLEGDNLGLLAGLAPGSVRLAYLDPPFMSGDRYTFRTRAGEARFEVPAFADAWPGGLAGYLAFLEDRLRLVARALADDGSLYLHLDARGVHYARVLLDEILGAGCFTRQIVWRIGWVSGFKSRAHNWIRNHDVILYYARPGAPFHRRLLPHPAGYVRRGGGAGAGRPVDDVWVDLPSIQIKSFSSEKTGWATQKNEALLRRIVEASSDPGDLVLDPFAGAGSTAVAVADTGRRFVVLDRSPLAIHLCRRRLLGRGAAFTVEGAAPEPAGEVVAEARAGGDGTMVRLLDVRGAAGPDGVDPLGRVDGWWVIDPAAPEAPVWQAHRPGGRRPGRVALETPALAGAGPFTVEAVDLAGRLHRGVVRA